MDEGYTWRDHLLCMEKHYTAACAAGSRGEYESVHDSLFAARASLTRALLLLPKSQPDLEQDDAA